MTYNVFGGTLNPTLPLPVTSGRYDKGCRFHFKVKSDTLICVTCSKVNAT